jgi:hypothetical protein
MAKTLNAMAVARSPAITRLMMAALMGPVDRNKQSCAVTMYTVYIVVEVVVRANQTNGAATSVATAESHKYACREFFAK